MDWAHERTKLLPRSGVGVVSHWLAVAPRGNLLIRIDLRALDQIRQMSKADLEGDAEAESEDGHDDDDKSDVQGPTRPNEDPRCHLLLVLGDLEVSLYIADGSEAVERIVRDAAPHTREATAALATIDSSQLLVIGNDPVVQKGELLQVGALKFRINEVRDYALRGANIPLPDGQLLQAAMAMLVVAAAERDEAAST